MSLPAQTHWVSRGDFILDGGANTTIDSIRLLGEFSVGYEPRNQRICVAPFRNMPLTQRGRPMISNDAEGIFDKQKHAEKIPGQNGMGITLPCDGIPRDGTESFRGATAA